jgi:acylphosphatase
MTSPAGPPDTPQRKALIARVSGRVQGVGFRFSAIRVARSFSVRGTVANRPDGGVEVVAEGAPENLARLVAWLQKGPPGAHVRNVEIEWIPVSGRYTDFDVEF